MALVAATAVAAPLPWQFTEPVTLAVPVAGVFHHLESAGRRNIAVSGDAVGVVWEDNRTGTSQIYAAFGPLGGRRFGDAVAVSVGAAAYEPVIAAVGDGQFVLAWQQDDGVWARQAAATGALSAPQRLAGAGAEQVSLAADGRQLTAVWSEPRDEGVSHIVLRELKWHAADRPLQLQPARLVDPTATLSQQFYPTVVRRGRVTTVAWEDRRQGHTVLLLSQAADGKGFAAPQVVNDQPVERRSEYGKGRGAARMVLTPWGRRGIAAVWLDKRDFTAGYDVYAAASDDGRRFGGNERVQDDFGNGISQWQATVAGDLSGALVAAWNDNRDDSADLWLAWRTDGHWSGDHPVPGAAGAGEQSSPAMVLDGHGGMHLVWIDRAEANGPTAVKYLYAPRSTTAIEKQMPSSKISPSL